jgi:hypothetical protein
MASLMTQIRSGLATRVATVTSLMGRTHSTIPDKMPQPPWAIVMVPSWDYHQPHGRITAEVLILAAPLGKGQERAQDKLDAYLDEDSSESIKAAIEAEPTLGGVAQDCIVSGWSEYGDVEVNGVSFLGAVLKVEVVA